MGALEDFSTAIFGTNANTINGITPIQDQGVLGKIGLALQGGQAVTNNQQNYNLAQLGQSLGNGEIDQSQYLKSMAQYSPETYNKMMLAQVQNTPAAVKTANDIQQLKAAAIQAYQNGDVDKANDLTDQVNTLYGVARAGAYGTKPFSLPSSQAAVQPNNAAVPVQASPITPIQPSSGDEIPPGRLPEALPQPESIPTGGNINAAPSSLPPEPIRDAGEPADLYKQRLNAWKVNPTVVSTLAEQGAAGKDTIKYNNEITADAKQAINMHQTIAAMQEAQSQFQAGALAPAQGTLLKYARALGVPIDKDSVSQLSNQQIFTKLQNDIIGQAAKAEGGASRLQSAFNAIKDSNPSIGLEPESLNTLFNLMDTKAGEVTSEQQAWDAAKTANPQLNASNFMRNYTAQRSSAQDKAGGNLPGYKGNAESGDLPKGTITNSDGTFTLPNGTKIRKKK